MSSNLSSYSSIKNRIRNKQKNDITLVVDRSASMLDIVHSTIDGINGFITEQKNSCHIQSVFTLITFDNKSEIVIYKQPIHKVRKIVFEDIYPRGSTRLIDTIMESILEQEKRINRTKFNGVFAVLTDGKDNYSYKFSKEDVNAKITKLQDKITTFFLGANQDAIISGGNLGFTPGHSLTFSADPTSSFHAIQSLSQCVSSSSDFSPLMREMSQGISY